MWSLCAPTSTYSDDSVASEPGRIATTFRAGAADGFHSYSQLPDTGAPTVPTVSCSTLLPNSCDATAAEMVATPTPFDTGAGRTAGRTRHALEI